MNEKDLVFEEKTEEIRGRVAPVCDSELFKDFLEISEEVWDDCKAEYFASDVTAADFPAICKRLKAVIRIRKRAAKILFGLPSSDTEDMVRALEMFDECRAAAIVVMINQK